MDKLLVIKTNKLIFNIKIPISSRDEIIKNPIPILWNFDGLYGWIPVEVTKNEIDRFLCIEQTSLTPISPIIKVNWQQTYRLRQDVGRMLEAQDNTIAGLTELLNEQMLEELGK